MCGTGTTGCHGWTEHNPKLAGDLGLRIATHVVPAERIPFVDLNGDWHLLDNDGGSAPLWIPFLIDRLPGTTETWELAA